MNSITKACRFDPAASVPTNWSCLPVNNNLRVPLASVEPKTWAAI